MKTEGESSSIGGGEDCVMFSLAGCKYDVCVGLDEGVSIILKAFSLIAEKRGIERDEIQAQQSGEHKEGGGRYNAVGGIIGVSITWSLKCWIGVERREI